jgi:hypothetical protein
MSDWVMQKKLRTDHENFVQLSPLRHNRFGYSISMGCTLLIAFKGKLIHVLSISSTLRPSHPSVSKLSSLAVRLKGAVSPLIIAVT